MSLPSTGGGVIETMALGGCDNVAAGQLLSRRLVVGLGRYGGLVARHIQAHLVSEPTEANQLTRVLDLQPNNAVPAGSADSSRRAARQQFLDARGFVKVFKEIDYATRQCARMPRIANDAVEIDPCLCIFIVADLADPFASGLVLDIARLADAASRGFLRSIFGIFGAGLYLGGQSSEDFNERRRGYCNVCAALREIDHAQSAGGEIDFQYGDPVPDTPPHRAFDQCFVVSEANRRGALDNLEEHACLTARFLFQLCCDDFLRRLAEFPKAVQDPGHAPDRPLYSSVGLASVFFPRMEAYAFCMERWAHDVASALCQEQLWQAPDVVAAYEDLRSVLPTSCEALGELIQRKGVFVPDVGIPGGRPSTFRQAAEVFSGIVDELEQASNGSDFPAEVVEFLQKKHIEPFHAKCRLQINALVERARVGVGLAQACLDRLYRPEPLDESEECEPLLNPMLAVAASQIRAIEEALVGRVRRCRQRLKQVLDAPPDAPVASRPFWLLHPVEYLRIIRQERQFNAHLAAWLRDLEMLRGLVTKKLVAVLTHRLLTTAAGIVEGDRKAIAALRARMAEAATAIGKKHREGMPRRLGVDRVLISPDSFETIYADRIRQAGPADLKDALKKLVVEDHLLAGFRNATAEQLAATIQAAGRRFFDGVKEMGLDSVLADSRYLRYISQPEDVFAGLWERADPLIDTNRAVLPDGWTIGEFSAIWLPNPNNPQVYGPSLAARGGSLHMNTGSATSIDLCRVIHGFTVPSMTLLRVYVTSYNAEPNKTELHILDWIDQLPSLPKAE